MVFSDRQKQVTEDRLRSADREGWNYLARSYDPQIIDNHGQPWRDDLPPLENNPLEAITRPPS